MLNTVKTYVVISLTLDFVLFKAFKTPIHFGVISGVVACNCISEQWVLRHLEVTFSVVGWIV